MTDADLLQYASEFRAAIIGDRDSSRMCAAICGPLAATFTVKGRRTLLMESELGTCNHVFIQVEDGRVLDPTADQFNRQGEPGFPRVYLGPATTIHRNASVCGHAEYWAPLIKQLARLVPQLSAHEVGQTVRLALSTLPASLCQLPC